MRILLVLALAACSRADGQPPPPASHVDCALIAVTLTSLELGNYAEPAQRGPREHELLAKCRAANLSDADAQCILDATKDTLASCPRPLSVEHAERPAVTAGVATEGLPGTCQTYLAAMERIADCPQLPAASRSAMHDAARQTALAWHQLGNNAQALAALQTACGQATAAIEQSLRSINCQ